MEIKVPLTRFAQFVQDAGKLDLEYPCLHQHQWLLDNFAFDDRSAHYEPLPMARPSFSVKPSPADGPYTSGGLNLRGIKEQLTDRLADL